MSTGNFNAIEKAVRLRTKICSLCVGALCACLVTGILLLACKLSYVELAWYYYLLTALGVGAPSGGIFFLIKRVSRRQLAEKLDSVYMLNERAQTMVQFEHSEDIFHKIQREDAERALGEITFKKPSLLQKIACVALSLVCVAALAVGIAIPQKRVAPPTPEGDKPFDLRAEQIADLRKLLENVSTDGELFTVDSALQTEYVAALNELLVTVQGGITNNQMKDAVTVAMLDVIEQTKAKISFDVIAEKLQEVDGVKFLGDAIFNAAKAYAITDKISYNYVKSQAGAVLDEAVATALKGGTDVISATVGEATDVPSAQLVLAALHSAIDTQIAAITEEELVLEDALYLSFTPLRRDLKTLSTVSGASLKAINDSLNQTVLAEFNASAGDALYRQSYSCLMRDYICQGLNSIFGVAIPEIPDDAPVEDEGSGGEGEGSGGGGSGDTVWPGNDEIFDSNDETYKHYGELLTNGKYAQILELLESNEVPSEVKSCILKYLDSIMSTQ